MNKQVTIDKIDYSKIVEAPEEILFYKDVAGRVVEYLEKNGKATFQEIIKFVAGSDRRTLRLLDQMVASNFLVFDKSYFKLEKSTFGNGLRASDLRCNLCDSKLVDISTNRDMKRLVSFMKNVVEDRPLPTFVFDQRPVTAETTVRRVAYAIWRGDVQNKRTVVIGDDDLMSIALARSGVAKKVVVFDIDERILNYIQKISKRYDLNITTVKHDLLKKVPSSYQNGFDVFFTDPTPTPKPLTLFSSVGLRMLSRNAEKVGYISLYPSHMAKTLDFQATLTRMKVFITDLIPFFNQYDFIKYTYSRLDLELLKKYASGEQKISFWEYFMRIETTEKTFATIPSLSPLEIMGTATERVLKDTSKDPVLSKKNKDPLIEQTAKRLKRLTYERKR